MKAVLCRQFGEPLSYEEVTPPPLDTGQVRVKVAACGINFPDTLIVQGKYQFKPELPFSPGCEVAGEIMETAPDVSGFAVGDRVIAAGLWGGFAEQMVAKAGQVMRRPDSMDAVTAAAFATTYGTSFHALKQRGALQPGETLLVLGAAGGVGLAAVELGREMGATVIAAASSEEKLALARQYGAAQTIDYSQGSLKEQIKALTGGRGVDVIYDPVGGDLGEEAVRVLAWNGRLLIVGFASGRIQSIPANLPLLKGASVVGVFWGAFREKQPELEAENFRQLFAWHGEGRLKPLISQTFPLARAEEALAALSARQALGKLVLLV